MPASDSWQLADLAIASLPDARARIWPISKIADEIADSKGHNGCGASAKKFAAARSDSMLQARWRNWQTQGI
jgi:hypothetical protein